MITSPSAFCTSCNRFIGPVATCPYCGADSVFPLIVRILRYVALPLAVIGLGCLYLAAGMSEPRVVEIAAITPMMNSAYVRVVGTVKEKVRVTMRNNAPDYLFFTVDDGTGRLQICARENVARDIVARNPGTLLGTSVDVAGSLSVWAGSRPKLYLRSADRLLLPADAGGNTRNRKPGRQ